MKISPTGTATNPLPLEADPGTEVDAATRAFDAAWDSCGSDVALIGKYGPVTPSEHLYLQTEARLIRSLRRRLTTTVRRSYPTADRVTINPTGPTVRPVTILNGTVPLAATRKTGTTTMFAAITPDIASLVRDFDQGAGPIFHDCPPGRRTHAAAQHRTPRNRPRRLRADRAPRSPIRSARHHRRRPGEPARGPARRDLHPVGAAPRPRRTRRHRRGPGR